MHARNVRTLRNSLIHAEECIRSQACRPFLRFTLAHRAHYGSISDPANPGRPATISLAHPNDPVNQPSPGQRFPYPDPSPPSDVSTPPDPLRSDATTVSKEGGDKDASSSDSFIPVKFDHPPIDPEMKLQLPPGPHSPPVHISPPFNTHKFFAVLERSFPTPVARNLMRASRGLLVDRVGRIKRGALTTQDLESQAYLFKAALSELRSETSMLTRNETAAMRAATTALRREVDALNTRMKEDLGTLKHEIQMDLDSRKNEARDDLKGIDIQVEEVLSRALITIGELKTQVEESRWEKMKAAVGALAALTFVIILSVEFFVVQRKNKPPPTTPPPPPPPEVIPPSTGGQPWVA